MSTLEIRTPLSQAVSDAADVLLGIESLGTEAEAPNRARLRECERALLAFDRAHPEVLAETIKWKDINHTEAATPGDALAAVLASIERRSEKLSAADA